MKTTRINSAVNAGPIEGTDLHWEEIEKRGYTECKAHYNKRYSPERELLKLWKDSYCGDRYKVLSIQLRAVGMSDADILVVITSDPHALIIQLICEAHELDYDEVVKTLKRL